MPRTGVIHVDDLAVEVTVRRVQRMNVRVHPPDGSVRLSVPRRMSDRAVLRFVRESRAWIEHHRARIREESRLAADGPDVVIPQGTPGELWRWFGRPLRLTVEASGRPAVVHLPLHRLVVRVPDPSDGAAVVRAVERWQRRELRRAALSLIAVWAPRLRVEVAFLGLRRMRTRWGSCIPDRRRIWLNLHLVELPPALLEYVVVHELAHLLEASHGPAFQRVMDLHLPDWRARRRRLDATS